MFSIIRTTDNKIMGHFKTRTEMLKRLAELNDTFRVAGLFTIREPI